MTFIFTYSACYDILKHFRWLSAIEDLIEQDRPPKQMADMINKIQQLGLRRDVAWLQ